MGVVSNTLPNLYSTQYYLPAWCRKPHNSESVHPKVLDKTYIAYCLIKQKTSSPGSSRSIYVEQTPW